MRNPSRMQRSGRHGGAAGRVRSLCSTPRCRSDGQTIPLGRGECRERTGPGPAGTRVRASRLESREGLFRPAQIVSRSQFQQVHRCAVTIPDLQKSAVSESGQGGSRSTRIRVGLVCDYAEELWPSMDLVGDMLCQYMAADVTTEVDVTQLRTAMRRRLSRVPLLGPKTSLNADRLLGRFWDYPRWLAKELNRFDLFHLVDHSYSQLLHILPPERTVVTCHDLDTFRCALDPQREPRPRWYRLMVERILDGFRKAAYVIVVSEATRAELLRYDLVPPNRIRVIHNGVHPAYSELPEPVADAEAARLLPTNSPGDCWL